jgi:hypothetical protein
MKAAEWVYLCVAHPVLGPGGGSGGGNGGMSSEVSFGLFGIVFVFWRDVAEVLEPLACWVGRVVRRSIIFCIRESRSQLYAFPARYSGLVSELEKTADKLSYDMRCVEKQGGPAYSTVEFGPGVSFSVSATFLS